MRIGAAEDMMVAGFDAITIIQADGWKSANVRPALCENRDLVKNVLIWIGDGGQKNSP